jgi:Kef-type K+ transport system membrane component KefB/nucleotide-binding universal stress UspA family protein
MPMTVVLAVEAGSAGGGFLTPIGHHDLLLFWIQLALLLGVARGLGGLARRAGQPAVVGELAAGLVLGPSILGRFAPGIAEWIFPGSAVPSALLLAVAWIGIFLLLVVTGFETDLALLKRLGRPAVNVSVGSLVVPLAVGVGLGFLLPSAFLGEEGARLPFALFMGVALSISALPVIAKILADMNLMRRDFGQITIAAGMANDLIGWLLLGVVAGIAGSGGFEPVRLLVTVVAVVAFLGISMTVGQRASDAILRKARGRDDSFTGALTATLMVALVLGVITHAIGVEAVLGALVAGIVLSRSKYQHKDVQHTLETLSNAVFAPIFFATAGLYVDFGVLLEGSNWAWGLLIILVAIATKLVGSYAGASRSGMSRMEGLAIGLGLNARGALEIVVATIGFSLGVLNEAAYAAVVVMAIVTSMIAPPLLRPVLRRLTANPEEAERLDREEMLQKSVIASASNVLLPTRGGDNSATAAHLLNLSLQPDARVTVLTVGDADLRQLDEDRISRIIAADLGGRLVERRHHTARDVGADILKEAGLGYDLLVVGLTDEFAGTHELSEPLRRVLASSPIPVLLIRGRRGETADGDRHPIRKVLVPVTGTRIGRAAEEIAYMLGGRLAADVDALHVVEAEQSGAANGATHQLERARTLSERLGSGARTTTAVGSVKHEALLQAAEDGGADLIVIGTQARSADGEQLFLGYGPEYVLEKATATVMVLVFPEEGPR